MINKRTFDSSIGLNILNFDQSKKYFPFESNKNEKVLFEEQVFWPIFLWKISIELRSKKDLDFFQETVLKLCNAGIRNAEEINEKTSLGKYLTIYIQDELRKSGYIDAHCKLTELGKAMISGKTIENSRRVIGYIFQDAFTGELFPRFISIEDKKIKEMVDGQSIIYRGRIDKNIEMIIGTEGNPVKIQGICMDLKNQNFAVPEKPSIFQIKKVLMKYQDEINRFEQINKNIEVNKEAIKKATKNNSKNKMKSEEGMDLEPVDNENTESLILDDNSYVEQIKLRMDSKISFCEDDPEPLYFWTFIFIPERGLRDKEWYFGDYFDLGTANYLKVLSKSQFIKKNSSIDKVMNRVENRFNTIDPDALYDFRNAIEKKANAAVENRISEDINKYKDLFKKLVEMEKYYLLFKPMKDGSAGNNALKIQKKNYYDILIICYSILETIFLIINQNFAPGHIMDVLNMVGAELPEFLADIAEKKIGFDLYGRQHGILSFFHLNAERIKKSVKSRSANFPAQLAGALISANEETKHPLYELASTYPDWLKFAYELKKMRDSQAAHSSTIRIEDTHFDEITTIIDKIYSTVSIMLGIKIKNELKNEKTQDRSLENFNYTLRNMASSELEKRYIDPADIPFECRESLLSMEEGCCKISLQSEVDTNDCRTVVINSYKVVEGAIHGILSVNIQKFCERTRLVAHNKVMLLEAINNFGYTMNKKTDLPYALSYVKPHMIDMALKYFNASLGAITIVMLAAVELESHNKELARLEPGMINYICDIANKRQHGDIVKPLSLNEISELRETTHKIMKAFIKINI